MSIAKSLCANHEKNAVRGKKAIRTILLCVASIVSLFFMFFNLFGKHELQNRHWSRIERAFTTRNQLTHKYIHLDAAIKELFLFIYQCAEKHEADEQQQNAQNCSQHSEVRK